MHKYQSKFAINQSKFWSQVTIIITKESNFTNLL